MPKETDLGAGLGALGGIENFTDGLTTEPLPRDDDEGVPARALLSIACARPTSARVTCPRTCDAFMLDVKGDEVVPPLAVEEVPPVMVELDLAGFRVGGGAGFRRSAGSTLIPALPAGPACAGV